MLGRNKKIAEEEYLVASGLKEPASFSVMEDEIHLEGVFKDKDFILHIKPENEGSLEILANCIDPFVQFESRLIPLEGSEIKEIPVKILAGKLHNGKNFARIALRTPYQEVMIPVTVENRIKVRITGKEPGESALAADLTRSYLDMRMGLIPEAGWQEDVLLKLDHISGNTAQDLSFMLMKAHVCIMSSKSRQARNIIEYVKSMIGVLDDKTAELEAYLLYVESLCTKNEEVTEKAVGQIRDMYDKDPSWPLLWMLFYTDESYGSDPERKIKEMQKLYTLGRCTSPVMYFEVYEAFRKSPELMDEISPFMLQTLNFAAKTGTADYNVCLRFADLVNRAEKRQLVNAGRGLLVRVLENAFEKYPVSRINTALARVLIVSGCRDKQYHRYYERAFFDNVNIPGLYNFYVFTADTEDMPLLPERILDYFSRDAASLLDKRTYFYANVITNRYRSNAYGAAYRACAAGMGSFALSEALSGRNDEYLSMIYADVLQKDNAAADLKRAVFKALSVRRLTCANRAFNWVLVFHEELASYQEVVLEAAEGGTGQAYINICSENVQILFKDAAGNIYKNVEYTTQSFDAPKLYIKGFIKDIPVNSLMLTGENLSLAKEMKQPEEILDYILAHIEKSVFTKEYENSLIIWLLKEFYEKGISDQVYKKLLVLQDRGVSEEAAALITGAIIKKKHYNEAYERIGRYGYKKTDHEILCSFTHTMVQLEGDTEKELLCGMCEKCVEDGCTDPEILRYLCRYYKGSLDMLLDIYEKSSSSGVYNLSVAEKILERAMAEDAQPEILPLVFARCYEESRNAELIHDYLEYCCGRYISGYKLNSLNFFEYFGKELLWERSFSDRANIAYLVYMSEKTVIPSNILKKIRSLLCSYVYRGIMLEEFKGYRRFFSLPGILANTHIASAVSLDPNEPVSISYEISSPEGIRTKTVRMREITEGLYVKYFTLFYGESLKYTVSTQENRTVSLSFADINPEYDGSRYSMVNETAGYSRMEDTKGLKEALENYYMFDRLMERLF